MFAGHEDTVSQQPTPHDFDLFVIHAPADVDFVRGYLIPALNLPPSRALLVDDLRLGVPIVRELERGVSRSRFTVAVISPAYLEDRWVVVGEQLATHLSTRGGHIIIPLHLADCELPLHLEARVSLDFTERTKWDSQAARLRALLQTTQPEVDKIRCPYPGMRPFFESDASRFFGRDTEVDDFMGRLDRGEREIYVVGPSGSGKSSLVYAGLLRALDSGASRLELSFVVRTMRPGEKPADRLARALDNDSFVTATTVDAFLARHPPAERVLVFVDQLEEIFTLTSAVERARFVAMLRLLRSDVRCYLLLALRADFFGMLLDSELGSDIGRGMSLLSVLPLRGAALAAAITEPAKQVGVHLEMRLCDRLIGDAAAEPGTLPLIQETLRLLWDKRRHRLIGLAEYDALGEGACALGVAIAKRAGTAMIGLSDAQQRIARRVLLRLVCFGEGRPDTRRQQRVRALRSAAEGELEFSRVLRRLIDDRLITVDGAQDADDALADLSHEVLITAWPQFHQWITRRRADELLRRRLEEKVGEWLERGRGAASLLDRVEILEAEQWMESEAAQELGYSAELCALVAASKGELERVHRQTQKARRLLGMSYLEHGRALLLGGQPMQALPYFVAARAEAIDGPVLRMLFAQASSNMPLFALVGHDAVVRSAAFSPDGTRVVTASWDRTARVWDATTGRPVAAPLEHAGFVHAAAFSPDGARVVTASTDNTARLWDAKTGQPATGPLEHQGVVRAAAFSRDGMRVITASQDKTARVWDASTGRPVTGPLEHHGSVMAGAFSPDGRWVVTASADKTARVWDAITGKPVAVLLAHDGTVTTATFSPDGACLITASFDKTARVWDASTGKPMAVVMEHQGPVTAAAFSADGSRVVTASSDKTARVWDARTGQPMTALLGHEGSIAAAAFSPDGARLVTAGGDKTVRVWDAITGTMVAAPLVHQGIIYDVAFSSDGTRVVVASADKTAWIWDAIHRGPPAVPLVHRDRVAGAAFSPDGARVVTASWDNTAQVWDARTGIPVSAALRHQGHVNAAAFSVDGMRVVTASADQTARVWDATSGRAVTGPLEHRGAVVAASFSSDGARVVTASCDRTARVWDARTGMPVVAVLQHLGIVRAAVFSADGRRIVTASEDNTAYVWDASTGKPATAALAHRGFVVAAAFSVDGMRVVTASWDKAARIWDASTGKLVTAPLEHQAPVHSAEFSADGARVVTASFDHTARVWDAFTGKPMTAPLEHRADVRAATFSGDGTRVVTASHDHTARVWDATTGRPITEPLEHGGLILAATFSADGTRVVTASSDKTARVWTLANDQRSLDDWRRLARRSPYVLVDGVLTPNHEPLLVGSQH
ncbi:MAG TPA: TIR domain-containing protein [Kofleriaceae bacterium]|nr:TIR domain-containing protein [Kofleriaceae bacterium]